MDADVMTVSEMVLANPDHIVHGTKACYDRHKCRCPKCRAANTAYMRQYRLDKKIRDLRAAQRKAS